MPHEYAVMKAKAGAILSAAQQAGSEALVLCAFGCGAFGNPPMDVAKIFRDLIVQQFRGVFKHISFSILEDHNSRRRHNPDGNVTPFVDAFQAEVQPAYSAGSSASARPSARRREGQQSSEGRRRRSGEALRPGSHDAAPEATQAAEVPEQPTTEQPAGGSLWTFV